MLGSVTHLLILKLTCVFVFCSSAILIVSHGDPLQIFQAVLSAAKENSSFLDDVSDLKVKSTTVAFVLSQHRKFALATGELRRVV